MSVSTNRRAVGGPLGTNKQARPTIPAMPLRSRTFLVNQDVLPGGIAARQRLDALVSFVSLCCLTGGRLFALHVERLLEIGNDFRCGFDRLVAFSFFAYNLDYPQRNVVPEMDFILNTIGNNRGRLPLWDPRLSNVIQSEVNAYCNSNLRVFSTGSALLSHTVRVLCYLYPAQRIALQQLSATVDRMVKKARFARAGEGWGPEDFNTRLVEFLTALEARFGFNFADRVLPLIVRCCAIRLRDRHFNDEVIYDALQFRFYLRQIVREQRALDVPFPRYFVNRNGFAVEVKCKPFGLVPKPRKSARFIRLDKRAVDWLLGRTYTDIHDLDVVSVVELFAKKRPAGRASSSKGLCALSSFINKHTDPEAECQLHEASLQTDGVQLHLFVDRNLKPGEESRFNVSLACFCVCVSFIIRSLGEIFHVRWCSVLLMISPRLRMATLASTPLIASQVMEPFGPTLRHLMLQLLKTRSLRSTQALSPLSPPTTRKFKFLGFVGAFACLLILLL